MLWFSIPTVVLLASIPVLVIISQTEGFSIRKYFTWNNINMLWCYLWAAHGAHNGDVLFPIFMATIMTIWCSIDSQEKGEWK